MSSTLGFGSEGNPRNNPLSNSSRELGGAEFVNPHVIPSQEFPSHISLPMIKLWRLAEAESFDALAKSCGGQELSPDSYAGNFETALNVFERRAPFEPGETYERIVLDRRILARFGHSEIVCSQLVHYAPQNIPSLSLFVSNEVVENTSLFPVLTKVYSYFSGSGGARTWEFSRNEENPFFSHAAYAHALKQLERFNGVTVDFDRRAELPLILRLAIEKSRGPLPKSFYPDESRQLELRVEADQNSARISFRSGRIGVDLECSLIYNRPVFKVVHCGNNDSFA